MAFGRMRTRLPGQAVEVEPRPQLDGELRHGGAEPGHDLAHEQAELPGHHDEHGIAGLDDRRAAPASSAVRPEPGSRITSCRVWNTSRRAKVVGSSTPSSKLRSYWMVGGWFRAWMTE